MKIFLLLLVLLATSCAAHVSAPTSSTPVPPVPLPPSVLPQLFTRLHQQPVSNDSRYRNCFWSSEQYRPCLGMYAGQRTAYVCNECNRDGDCNGMRCVVAVTPNPESIPVRRCVAEQHPCVRCAEGTRCVFDDETHLRCDGAPAICVAP